MLVEVMPSSKQMELAPAGGFNSGTLSANAAYQRVFPSAGVIFYKDGVGNNCRSKNATGTIYVGPRPSVAPQSTSSSTMTRTTGGNGAATSSSSVPVTTASQPHNGANSLIWTGSSILLAQSASLAFLSVFKQMKEEI
ncbi:hypothetical protein BGX28_003641 [Mortierella sp. GBA30]|nr:hypothetical protein BGX28_003641 [Mortierella sp. GBA30]